MRRICRVPCLPLVALLLLAPSQGLAGDEDLEPKALFQKRCTKCHNLERTNREESSEFWRATVRRMREKFFSGISDRDMEIIADYLFETRSK
jgi:hypothetical protein